jgi:hypothetical protein
VRSIVATVFALAAISCATTSTAFKTGDGSRGYRIDCSHDPGDGCINKATELCPEGFDPISASDDLFMGSTMTVKCKG